MFASFAEVEITPLDRFATETRVFDDMIVRLRLVGAGIAGMGIAILAQQVVPAV